ncbi:MAG: succinate dehydrogenase [Acidobacteria bacterium]|nr:succinate dehydrogenase [Acidobacteriota bacterium]
MAATGAPAAGSGFGSTLRRDAWWVEVLPVIVLLGGFGLYATLRAFEGKFYEWGPYLSPFYSPLIDANHRWWKWSPAILILGGPLSFRATCYYYRKAYYRAFFADPPACAVGEPKRSYSGETKFPFILQNLHRYALYLAIVFLAFLWKDAYDAFWWDGKFGVGVGTLVLLVNIILLTTYTLSCHSLRHLAGGKLDCFSCASFGKPRYSAWSFLTRLNERHMLFAWMSLISVGFADFYIRMVASGAFHDVRIF